MIEDFSRQVLAFIAARRDTLGSEAGGLYEYYVHRLENDLALSAYEQFLLSELNGERRIFDVGIGLGILSMALARAGVEMIGFEYDRRRYHAAEAMRAALGPDLPYRLRHARFPDGLQATDHPAGATLLFTNVGSGWSSVDRDAAIAAFGLFGQVILDLRLFGRLRDRASERAALQARIERAGHSVSQLVTGVADAHYVRITPQPALPATLFDRQGGWHWRPGCARRLLHKFGAIAGF